MTTIPKLFLKKLKRVHWNQIELIDWWKTNLRGKGTEGIVVVKEGEFRYYYRFSLFGISQFCSERPISQKRKIEKVKEFKWMKITFWNHFEKTNGRKKTNTRKRMWFLTKRKSNEKFLDGKKQNERKGERIDWECKCILESRIEPILLSVWKTKRKRYQFDPDCQICLSWRLSHACVSISRLKSETANGSINRQWSEQRWERGFRASFERITMEKLWLIRE